MDGDIQREYDRESLPSRQDSSVERKHCGFLSELGKWRVWKAIILGQFISGLLCGTGVTSQFLQGEYKVHIPTAQSFMNYVLLCMLFTTWLACRSGEGGLIPVLRTRGWKYFCIAAVDVEANFLIVKAYQYTTLTSIQLLDCFTIPTVLALSWLALKIRYKIVHVLGVGVALVGVGCLVWADTIDEKGTPQASNRLLGDMLCLSGAALYGTSNVAEEYFVKSYDIVEFLGMLGLFGSVINGIQLAILERNEIATINWDRWQEVALLLGFSLCLFLIYVTMPVVLRLSSATTANLSILTADFYSLVIGIYVFEFKFHWLYFVSFFLVLTGIIAYSTKPTPLAERSYREVLLESADMQPCRTDLELSGHHQQVPPCSTISYNSISCNSVSTRDNSLFSLASGEADLQHQHGNKEATSIAHSVSVHSTLEQTRCQDRRNGSATFPKEC